MLTINDDRHCPVREFVGGHSPWSHDNRNHSRGSLRSVVLKGPERRHNVNDLGSQLDRPSIDKSIGAIDRTEVVARWQFDADCCPVVIRRNIQNANLPANGTRSPIGMVDLDLTLADNLGYHRYVPERHAEIRSETQDAAGTGYRTSVIETRRAGPPMPGIAEQPDIR
jgi:hypothetical protein